jgi:hypothetical protein
MPEILDSPDQNIYGLKYSGTLTEEDLDHLVAFVEEQMEKYTTVRFLFEMDDVDDWEPEERWTELSFDLRHVRSVDKVAVLGDDLWDEWLQQVNFAFPESEIETFDLDDEEDAWDWIRGEMAVPGIGPGSVPDPEAGAQDEDDE